MDNIDWKDFEKWLWENHRIDEITQTEAELEPYVEEYLNETV